MDQPDSTQVQQKYFTEEIFLILGKENLFWSYIN